MPGIIRVAGYATPTSSVAASLPAPTSSSQLTFSLFPDHSNAGRSELLCLCTDPQILRLSRHDYFADRPKRYSSELQMRPRDGMPMMGDSQEHGCDEMAQR